MKRNFIAIFLSGLWINLSEFLRNELLFKSVWLEHYQKLNLNFPSAPINGIFWMIWGFIFAILINLTSKKFSFLNTFMINWIYAFVMMWIVLFNLSVMPQKLLIFAIPLSLIETFVATYINKKFK